MTCDSDGPLGLYKDFTYPTYIAVIYILIANHVRRNCLNVSHDCYLQSIMITARKLDKASS